jgi:serine/threonine protein kinase
MTDSLPEKLGKYKIIEEVGRGGFAAVYKAVDTTLDRTVALKCLAPHLLWDPTFVQRFQREAKVAANLDHPNIVTIHEVSRVEGVYFIAMQFLKGRTVSQILEREGPLPVSQVQAIIEQIASALDYAHARGFVHRDVKPSNVIVADDGRATLTDFGLVKAGEGTKLSTTGVIFGTPEYMSPEQAEGKKLDARSDIYSLGVVLFEMLAGRAPFVADTSLTVMYKHVHESPPLDELPSDLPQGVVAVVEKALAKDPTDRYQNAGQMVEALRKAAAEAPVPAEVAPPPPPAVAVEERPAEVAPLRPKPKVAPPPLVKPVAALKEEAVPSWRRVPLWGWALGGLILLAAVVVGGILLGGGNSRTLKGHTNEVWSVAFSPDGETLASGSADTTVRLWRVSDGSTLRTLEGHTLPVTSVAFSPDGATLASGSNDDTVRLWRVSEGSLLRTLEGHTDTVWSVTFSPDGETLTSGALDSTVCLWRVSDGTLLHTMEGHKGSVRSVAFSPDGETLASGSYDDTVRLWRVSDGRLLRTLWHTNEVWSVAFSPDGAMLASGSEDGTVRLWRVATD